jgi:hypothetical protein
LLDAPLIPIGVLGTQMTQQHPPGTGVHPAGDAQALRARFGANDLRHVFLNHLDALRLTLAGFHAYTLSPVSGKWQTTGVGDGARNEIGEVIL